MLFSVGRKHKHIQPLFYIEAAHMEYHSSGDVSVACKIYELALKAFPDNQLDVYVAYLQFLLGINNITSRVILV